MYCAQNEESEEDEARRASRAGSIARRELSSLRCYIPMFMYLNVNVCFRFIWKICSFIKNLGSIWQKSIILSSEQAAANAAAKKVFNLIFLKRK